MLQEPVFPTMEVTNLHEATRIFPSSTDPSTNAELTPTPERSQTPQGFKHETTIDSELLESQLINDFFPEHTHKKTFNATVGDHKSLGGNVSNGKHAYHEKCGHKCVSCHNFHFEYANTL